MILLEKKIDRLFQIEVITLFDSICNYFLWILPKKKPLYAEILKTSTYRYKPYIVSYIKIPAVEITDMNRSAKPSRRKLSSMWIPELR